MALKGAKHKKVKEAKAVKGYDLSKRRPAPSNLAHRYALPDAQVDREMRSISRGHSSQPVPRVLPGSVSAEKQRRRCIAMLFVSF